MVINTVSVSWIPVLLVHFGVAVPHFAGPCADEPERSDPPGYNVASDMLTKSINLSADPCSNFYEFTCGNWRGKSREMNNIGQSGIVEKRVRDKLREILEWTDVYESKSARAVKAMYRKCVDKERLDGVFYLLEEIRDSFVSWPMLEGHKWRGEYFDLTTVLIKFYESRLLQVFVRFGVGLDQKNISRRLIWVQLLRGDAGVDPANQRQIEYEVGEIMNFESKLAKIMVAEEDRRNQTEMHNPRRLSEMRALMPWVDWTNFFYSIMPPIFHGYLETDPQILIKEIDYMKRLTKLLKSTDLVVIANYVYTCYCLQWGYELGMKYHRVLQKLHNLVYGQRVARGEWMDCVSRVMIQMPSASGALYLKQAFDEETKNVALEMVSYAQKAFRDMLVENDWLDSSTKASAINKARKIQRAIGYPDFILDDKKLDDCYSGLYITESDSYTEMVKKWVHWRINVEFQPLMEPVDRSEVNFDPMTVNAFYVQESNAITLPAAILQAPFFHKSFPKALNYGGIGNVIGREITRGFDDHGRQYDDHGILQDWWDDKVEEKFRKRAQCFTDQYHKIEVPGIGLDLNSALTQREIIADHGGVKAAFKVSCEHQTAENLIDQFLHDKRFPSKYGVNQVLANQPEFAAAFNCPVGTPMNPTNRCAVW